MKYRSLDFGFDGQKRSVACDHDFKINQIIYDEDGYECIITDMTPNSIEVLINAKSTNGINNLQWFATYKPEIKRFKLNKK
jgi:hypothetical protein